MIITLIFISGLVSAHSVDLAWEREEGSSRGEEEDVTTTTTRVQWRLEAGPTEDW